MICDDVDSMQKLSSKLWGLDSRVSVFPTKIGASPLTKALPTKISASPLSNI
jgi:hypothetical protein